ncbi:diadenosine tetraphosphate hydrolase [Candidatus Dependentiae bacterium HGW-Dependentiae-1]|nr:MAG: diadenosine tetraphosphate hydrolase [Candidatus Dependentiae bacterium HGW-Dependentiae-1]
MKKQTSAGIVVYYQADKDSEPEFLLLHYLSGHWDLPKGKLEEGEDTLTAAVRELQEETGLTDARLHDGFSFELSYTFKGKDGQPIEKTVTFFLGSVARKEVTLSHEHIGYAWIPYQLAHRQLTFANAKELLQKAAIFLREKGLLVS